MKWRDVKILCAGMCICTFVAAAFAPAEEAQQKTEPDAAVFTEEENDDAQTADAEVLDLPRVGAGNAGYGEMKQENRFDLQLLGEPRRAENLQTSCETEELASKQSESNLMIADVSNYVNVRSLPSEEGEILGKLFDASVGRKLGEENGWYLISSGSVTGFVKADYVLIGEEAELRAKEAGTRLAEVATTTLKVRQEPSMQAVVLGLVPMQEVLKVLEEIEGWVKVDFEDGSGYVSAEYVKLYTENTVAESKEEEAARLKKEEEERKRAEEAAKKALAAQQTGKPSQTGSSAVAGSSTGNSGGNTSGNGSSTGNNSGSVSGNGSGAGNNSGSVSGNGSSAGNTAGGSTSTANLGQEIADYALKFLGNPYVYGGTSLTNGADCSGFVQSVYKHFGISLPRTSAEQGKAGRAVDGTANAKAGDLVWYSGHIGIYIGNEQVVHASNPKNGIIISNVHYRKILGIRRIV